MSNGTPLDIKAWLEQLGLAQYAQAFADNDIDGALVARLSADELREMGVISIGHRRRILDAAAALATPPAAPSSPSPSPSPGPAQSFAAAHPGAASAPTPGADSAARAGPRLQRRQITVMFCDLVGSTALSARVDPEDLREHLNHFRNLLASRVQEHGGWIAQYLGDGVLAYFGYPIAHEHDAEQAVKAALAIIEGLASLPGLPAQDGLPEQVPQVRIGVATGTTVIGAMLDADASSEHNAVGQTPNLAARAQSVAEANTVVVTAETRQLIGGLFECLELGRYELKGFTQPVPLWQVKRESPLASRFDALRASSRHALVGRDEEAARILQRLHEARGGRGRLVVITGEGGLGKSRLAGHVVHAAQLASGPRLIFQCSPYHVSTPLHSVRYYFERASGIAASDSAPQAMEKLAAVLSSGAAAAGANTTSNSTTAQPLALLAELLRFKRSEGSTLNTLGSVELRRQTMKLLASELEAAARRATLVIIEDAQWVDPSSAEVFSALLSRLAGLPVLVIATMRPGPLPTWLAEVRSEIVALDRLDAASTRALVRTVAAPQVLAADVEDAVVARSDGVPLFAEELTRACLEGATDVATSGAGDSASGSTEANSSIPSTLVESLLARLDRYPHGRELAPLAAVLGREISVDLLVAVSTGVTTLDRAGVQRGIRELLDAGVFVAGHSRFGVAIAFRHMLVREAAYQLLLRRERQRLHAHAAHIIETTFTPLAEALPQVVARHLTEAGDTERATQWWERAASDANHRSAYQESIAHFQRALKLTMGRHESPDRDLREFELRRGLVGPLIAATGFQTPEVGREISRCIALAEGLGAKVSMVATLALKWMWHGPAGDLRVRAELSQRMHEVAKAGGTEVDRLWAHRFLGTSLVFAGHFAQAQVEYEAFLGLYDEAHHDRALAYVGPSNHHLMVLVGMAEVATFFNEAEQVVHWRKRSLAVARADGRVHNLCQALVFAGCLTATLAADGAALQEHASELHELTHAEDDRPVWRGHAELFLGLAQVLNGQADAGFALAAKGVRTMRAQKAAYDFWYIPHADACCQAGRLEEAQASLELAEPTRAIGLEWMEAERLRVQGQLRLRRGEPLAAARDDLQAALALAREQQAALFIERAEVALAGLPRAT